MGGIAVAEIARARIGWVDPADTEYFFNLRGDYEPGSLGFDPLGLYPKDKAGQLSIRNKELNNGRLAMLATAGFVLRNSSTGNPFLRIFRAKLAVTLPTSCKLVCMRVLMSYVRLTQCKCKVQKFAW